MSHLTKSKSQQEIHFDELFSRIMKIGAKKNQQKNKIESTELCSSLKLEPITLTGKSKNSSKIHKINSINTESSQSFIEKDERISQKKKQNPIYLQKLKLVLAKNESLLATPNSNKMEEKDSPLKGSTLRQLMRIDNQRKKEQILSAVENLKLEMNSA